MVSFAPPPPSSSSSTSQVPDPGTHAPPAQEVRPLDILFLQDSTGSQGTYIKSARSAIQDICEKITANTSLSKGSIRFGLIAFRDHPPQDTSYVTKNFGFTADPSQMKKNLDSLIASGGGDGPEAQTAALAEALNMEWAGDAVKIVVLITDAPPHGLGEPGDGFLESPDQNDPIEIVRQMAERGITLYVIACEPTLSTYRHAVDFYRAICQITSGRMVPLLNAAKLGDYIVGSAVETIETEKLIGQFQHVILEDVYGQGKPLEEVMNTIQEQLSNQNVQITTLNVEDVYAQPSAASEYNTHLWSGAASLNSARGKTKTNTTPILKEAYSSTRASTSGARSMGGGFLRTASSKMRPTLGGASPPRARGGPSTEIRGRASASAPGALPPPAPSPAVSMAPQAINQSQTKRVVMQSLMRGSKIGPGNVLTPTGEYASKAPISEPMSSPSAPET